MLNSTIARGFCDSPYLNEDSWTRRRRREEEKKRRILARSQAQILDWDEKFEGMLMNILEPPNLPKDRCSWMEAWNPDFPPTQGDIVIEKAQKKISNLYVFATHIMVSAPNPGLAIVITWQSWHLTECLVVWEKREAANQWIDICARNT